MSVAILDMRRLQSLQNRCQYLLCLGRSAAEHPLIIAQLTLEVIDFGLD